MIELGWSPAVVVPLPLTAVLSELTPDGERFDSSGDPPWNYNITTTTNLVSDFSLELEERLPSEYAVGDLKLSVPFNYEKQVKIWMFPTKVGTGPIAVRTLFATGIKEFSIKRLYSFYQQSRAIATRRIARVKNTPQNNHVYDIQAAFKFLEASLELNKRTKSLMRHSEEIHDVRDWLIEAHSLDSELVQRAIGQNYQQIVDQIAEEEANLMTVLWRRIKDIPSCSERIAPLRAFYDRFKRSDDLAGLESEMRIKLGTVLSSLNQCVVDGIARNDEIPAKTRAAYVTNQIEETRIVLASVTNEPMANRLRSDIDVMKRDVAELNSGF